MSARVCPLAECVLRARLNHVRVKTAFIPIGEDTDVLFMSGSLRHSAPQKQGILHLPMHWSRVKARTIRPGFLTQDKLMKKMKGKFSDKSSIKDLPHPSAGFSGTPL
uniref:Uncharacterized protein n=1 Tax=Mus spicilegus TaxID=10103 RepID=A0A8C6HDM2_MUSSI